ncbi:MAG: ornithine carbamoyltransferase [Desulfobacterales bacterium]
MKKDILTLLDLTKEDFDYLFERAIELKKIGRENHIRRCLAGKTLGMIFDKPSTRTRISFESAMIQLGGMPIFINARDTQIARDEPVRDTVRVLSRYIDALAIRTFSQDLLHEFALFADIPVINALTDLYHPTQVLSDIMTVIEKKGGYENLKIAWVGDGNNVANSWINAASILGLNLVLACPPGYEPDERLVEAAKDRRCGTISVTSDPEAAVDHADVIYTDVWASMGQEDEQAKRRRIFQAFTIDKGLVNRAAPDVIVMHCLPAHRGEEISEDVLEGPRSVVWDQSENKMHMNKAILESLINQSQS